MAEWPANADTDWNTKMKANIDVGHDSDGTHKKSQMLTDMEWSPTAAVGGNDSIGSMTFPNGVIIKWGSIATGGSSNTTVTFATAFPDACFQGFGCGGSSGTGNDETQVHTISKTAMTVRNTNHAFIATIRWFAIGR